MEEVKRLIFDFDNTLIMWKKEYIKALKMVIAKYNLKADLLELDYALNHCNQNYGRVDIETMIKAAHQQCNVKITKEILYNWMDLVGSIAIDIEEETKETLEYLSNKYSIVILSNFITYCQKLRALNAGIDRYIEEYYGAGYSRYVKPHPASFREAIGDYKVGECVMIGDDMKEDIDGALAFGLKAIFVDNHDVIKENEQYPYLVIKKVSDLRNIL